MKQQKQRNHKQEELKKLKQEYKEAIKSFHPNLALCVLKYKWVRKM